MYTIGKEYKIQLKNKIYYQAIILEEDNIQLRIKDKFGDEIIINKDEILQSKLVQNNIGVKSWNSVSFPVFKFFSNSRFSLFKWINV